MWWFKRALGSRILEVEGVCRVHGTPAVEKGLEMVLRKVVDDLTWFVCRRWVITGRISAYSGIDLGLRVIGGGGSDRRRRFCSCACERRIRRAMTMPSARCWSALEGSWGLLLFLLSKLMRSNWI